MSRKNCASPGFKSLMVTQFLGAFNDNVFKVILTLLVVNALVKENSGITHLVLINVFFVAPFILFSQLAGSLSDRYSKTRIIRAMKLFEIVAMLLGMWCIAQQEAYLLLGVLFLTGFQSTIFSPAKYGILPEILDDESLSRGNGYIQFWTFLAIIGGTALGGFLSQGLSGSPYLPGLVLTLVAVVGAVSSMFVTKTPAADSNRAISINPVKVFSAIKEIRADRGLFLSMVAISYFWAVASLYQLNIALYAKQMSGWSDVETALLMAALGVGIGVGSLAAGAVSAGKVELGLVPLGALGLTIFGSALSLTSESYALTLSALVLLGLSAGFYIVPINAYLQENSPSERRGQFLAATNFVSFTSMLFSSFLLLFLVDGLGLDPAQVFLLMGGTAALAAIYICTILPEILVRCVNWILVHTVYRLNVLGRHNVPSEGGALIVCNHVSFVDAPLLLASLGRPLRFMMYRPIYEKRLIKPFAKLMGVIPVQAGGSRKDVTGALQAASDAIAAGELVCIFAEGGISRIGQLLQFKRGLERIMAESKAPIIPVHLDRVWGSIFSYQGGKFFWKKPETIPYPITVSFGAPLPADSSRFEVRQAVEELSADAFPHREKAFQVLHLGLLRKLRRNPFRRCIKDFHGKWLRAWQVLLGALMMARMCKERAGDARAVGVYLPPSVGGVLVNAGLLLAGKVPVNLNYTASKESLKSAISQCDISLVISAKKFLDKVAFPVEEPSLELLLVDEQDKPGLASMIAALFALILPEPLLLRMYGLHGGSPQELATIIFSSGSTGEPKGVMLSHANISSNLTALYDVQEFQTSDCVVGILPFFHSFGYTGTLWLPLLSSMRAVYYPNPLDAKIVGRLTDEAQATILISTPTFLQTYLRKIKPEQFASLRCVFVGAEKLPDRVRDAFVERFAVAPREGYGCTELSPVAIANIEDFEKGRMVQHGSKSGSVGRTIPGVAARVVDVDSGEILGANEDGLLLIKGPNVMMGYLGNEALTSEVIRDGWYVTGDIARIDEDGFVTITDRLSRFSKIGGEMVPHVRIEDEIHSHLGRSEAVCAVTAIPDEKKGERLVVLSLESLDGAGLAKELKELGLPNLWIPRPENYFVVEELPMLGSGKMDLKRLKETALSLAGV